MRLFLDTSVLLSACASATGASREIFARASGDGWQLVVTPYVIDEVLSNLPGFPLAATAEWARLQHQVTVRPDVVTCEWPVIFPAAKDRPILFGALAWADILLTLDRKDFGELLDGTFYGLSVMKPGTFIGKKV